MRDRYREIRQATRTLVGDMTPEDCQAQSMEDASPVKWHLAHTTWFFETFVLESRASGYSPFHPEFRRLFNSYYNAVGERLPRSSRGLMTRPALDEVLRYRDHVDRAMDAFWTGASDAVRREIAPAVELGLHHEQQHQELILTDLKHLFSLNPLSPAVRTSSEKHDFSEPGPLRWASFPGGLVQVGAPAGAGFSFDIERPVHSRFVPPFRIASRPVTCGEFLGFMEEGGYRRPEFWLSDGWSRVRSEGWEAPLYWQRRGEAWHQFTMAGLRPVHDGEPVCHVSFYEADAYARWSRARLPREEEWEIVARAYPVEGNFAETRRYHPQPAPSAETGAVLQMFGDVWEWTQSPYAPYPGYQPPAGALGEYNGKFMCNQFILRGGSCATPAGHVRPTYRNFFPPEARWQFSGFRLAAD